MGAAPTQSVVDVTRTPYMDAPFPASTAKPAGAHKRSMDAAQRARNHHNGTTRNPDYSGRGNGKQAAKRPVLGWPVCAGRRPFAMHRNTCCWVFAPSLLSRYPACSAQLGRAKEGGRPPARV